MLVFKKYGFQTKIKSNLNEEGVFFSFVPRAFHDSLLLHNEKVEISQYTKQGFPYVCRALIARLRTEKSSFPLFLAELVAFDIGKVEISQYTSPVCERKSRNTTHI
jgi:hypothetical protein